MTFADVVLRCYDDPEMLARYDRLRGSNLSCRGSALDLMIDVSSERREQDLLGFIEFVREAVWERLPPEAFRTAGEGT